MNDKHTTSATPRRLFNRVALATALGALAAGVGFTALADGDGHGRWQRGGFMHAHSSAQNPEQRVERMLKHFYVEIDATEAQKQKLDPIVRQAAKDLLPLRAQMQAARKQGVELLAAESIDRAAIESFRARHLQLADSATKRFSQALADVAEVLTPEQRKGLSERIERMRGMHGGRHHG